MAAAKLGKNRTDIANLLRQARKLQRNGTKTRKLRPTKVKTRQKCE